MITEQPLNNKQPQTLPPKNLYEYPKILPNRDILNDPMTGERRAVWSIVIPIICHRTNEPFYAQCSTKKEGYCSRCNIVREGSGKKTGSCCNYISCGERLNAKYHRWYPGLIRIQPINDERNISDYKLYEKMLEKFGITWNDDEQLKFVMDNYLLLKVYVNAPDFDIAPLHLERAYMIGVFAGRKFQTGAIARKFLRDGLKLLPFRDDFPKFMKFMPNERSKIVEEMNTMFFQGCYRCYFHGHKTNIEGWYDPTQINPVQVKKCLHQFCERYIDNINNDDQSSSSCNSSVISDNESCFSGSTCTPRSVFSSSTTSSTCSSSNSSTVTTTAIQPVSYTHVYVNCGGQQYMAIPVQQPVQLCNYVTYPSSTAVICTQPQQQHQQQQLTTTQPPTTTNLFQ